MVQVSPTSIGCGSSSAVEVKLCLPQSVDQRASWLVSVADTSTVAEPASVSVIGDVAAGRDVIIRYD